MSVVQVDESLLTYSCHCYYARKYQTFFEVAPQVEDPGLPECYLASQSSAMITQQQYQMCTASQRYQASNDQRHSLAAGGGPQCSLTSGGGPQHNLTSGSDPTTVKHLVVARVHLVVVHNTVLHLVVFHSAVLHLVIVHGMVSHLVEFCSTFLYVVVVHSTIWHLVVVCSMV